MPPSATHSLPMPSLKNVRPTWVNLFVTLTVSISKHIGVDSIFAVTLISHSYKTDQSISVLCAVGWNFSFFIPILMEYSVSKEKRSRSVATICGV